eukprot:10675172-Prorocentrum_lima.AAC.1
MLPASRMSHTDSNDVDPFFSPKRYIISSRCPDAFPDHPHVPGHPSASTGLRNMSPCHPHTWA